jgi:hypothetical protein
VSLQAICSSSDDDVATLPLLLLFRFVILDGGIPMIFVNLLCISSLLQVRTTTSGLY